jgi:hypothetical protein
MIPVRESYINYRPPRHVLSTVTKLLQDLPSQALSGLQSVVLTNSQAVGGGKTHRVKGRKYARRSCLGFYHPKESGEQPWIEIVVDNAIACFFPPGPTRVFSYVPILREMLLADVLFHEIGHHLDHTVGAPAPSGEAAAEAWQKRLIRSYMQKRLWVLIPLMRFTKRVARVVRAR